MSIKEKLSDSWYEMLKEEFNKEYMKRLAGVLAKERKNYTIYPPSEDIFRAYRLTPFTDVKVVILGEEPYHTLNVADGLSFSTPNAGYEPPQLTTIFEELENEFNILNLQQNTDLSRWAKQGVFLLNMSLSVRENEPNSHQFIGWKEFTTKTIELLNLSPPPIVFMLWGREAHRYLKLIDTDHHLVLTASYPSPSLAHHSFNGCNHFVEANEFLASNKMHTIDWFKP